VALSAKTGEILWKTFDMPDNGGQTNQYSGGAVWQPPAIDPKRDTLFIGTGNNYTAPPEVEACENETFASDCTAANDYFDTALALDLKTGRVKWAKKLQGFDTWTVACLSPSGQNPNCPVPTSEDFDLGGAGPNLLNNVVGFGQKSGIYWALNPDNGNIVWSTPVGPGSSLGGIPGLCALKPLINNGRLLKEICHHIRMRSLKVFAASLVFMSATLLPAQRAGAGAGAGFGGHPSGGSGGTAHGNRVVIRGGNGHRGHNRGNGFGYPWYLGYGDYWDDPGAYGDYGPDGPPNQPAYQPQSNGMSPSVIVMQSPQRMTPSAPAPSPKLVEVPQDGPATPAKEQPPALFVLQNGQHIESDHYVLSDKSVTVDVGRQQRTIPLSDIDLKETMAENRQRGVEIAFPRDSNSLFMSF